MRRQYNRQMIYQTGGFYSTTERIVAIVYNPNGPRRCLLPFSAFTVRHDKPPKDGWISGIYDIEWCRRDGMLYYHCSGGGGHFYLNRVCRRKGEPHCAVWWNSKLVTPHRDNGKQPAMLTPHQVRRLGYRIVSRPLRILGTSDRHPLENLFSGLEDTMYCSKCDDWLPFDNMCSHVLWCDECGWWSTPSEPCRHNRV